MKALGIVFSTVSVGLAGDPINGSSHRDVLEAFQNDPEEPTPCRTVGEIGGPQKPKPGLSAKEHMKKPVIAHIAVGSAKLPHGCAIRVGIR